jgi:hypothetical protein
MKVTMINSVGKYVAGEEYEIEDSEADRFIILGYAEGTLSREPSDEERAAIEATHQAVSA